MKVSERQLIFLLAALQHTLYSTDSLVGGMTRDFRRELFEQIMEQQSNAPVELTEQVNIDVSKFNQ